MYDKPSRLPGPLIATVLIGLGIAAVSAYFWKSVGDLGNNRLREQIQNEAADSVRLIRSDLEGRVQLLSRMADRWEIRGGIPREEWESDALNVFTHDPGYQALEWVDPSFRVNWIIPVEGNEDAVNLDITSEEKSRRALESAREKKEVTFTGAIELVQGGKGFLVIVPVFLAEELEGFFVAVFRYGKLLGTIFNRGEADSWHILVEAESTTLYTSYVPRSINSAQKRKWEASEKVEAYGVDWEVKIWPNANLIYEHDSWLPEIILLFGLVFSLLLPISIYLRYIVRTRTAESINAKTELQNLSLNMQKLIEKNTAELRIHEDGNESSLGAHKHFQRKLNFLNKELEQFVYVTSHDLQEPLRMVASYVELLADRYRDKLDEKANKYIRYTVDGTERMQILINDLLAYSRVGAKKRPFEEIDISELVQNVLHNLSSYIEENGAEVIVGDLPAVMGDKTQLTRLFHNLIQNAIKFRRDLSPVVEVFAENGVKGVVFNVKDNGIGIDTKFFDRIFLIFKRLGIREQYEGTGLGLAITKKIVEHHGGEIWVESKPEVGSLFSFTIPGRSLDLEMD